MEKNEKWMRISTPIEFGTLIAELLRKEINRIQLLSYSYWIFIIGFICIGRELLIVDKK